MRADLVRDAASWVTRSRFVIPGCAEGVGYGAQLRT
jgi:hypothetical protein